MGRGALLYLKGLESRCFWMERVVNDPIRGEVLITSGEHTDALIRFQSVLRNTAIHGWPGQISCVECQTQRKALPAPAYPPSETPLQVAVDMLNVAAESVTVLARDQALSKLRRLQCQKHTLLSIDALRVSYEYDKLVGTTNYDFKDWISWVRPIYAKRLWVQPEQCLACFDRDHPRDMRALVQWSLTGLGQDDFEEDWLAHPILFWEMEAQNKNYLDWLREGNANGVVNEMIDDMENKLKLAE